MGCDLKSEGTVCTLSVSTSIREEVEAMSLCSTWGGAGARFYRKLAVCSFYCGGELSIVVVAIATRGKGR
jgi:hypothetical protein